ncbi:MAG: 2-isopropylmalate synthase [Alphaproteobacteria bacterium]|nr:2-isopropylmalate synthase [Alphaproteobacteria bacterium]
MFFIPDKYKPFPPIDLPNRQWPSRTITAAPIWCSVDLRDGNQALIEPMGAERKIRMWNTLIALGFKQIEVGFPAASETDFQFFRHLIDNNLIPEDVTIQALTQARPELIERTFDSLKGVKQAIVHLYNSTSTTQRRVVFNLDRNGVKKIATDGAEAVKRLCEAAPETDWMLQYSPESFTGTELDFAIDVCEGVYEVWDGVSQHPTIFNLPATVEMATPNVFADQIEFFGRHFSYRNNITLSVHPHNDRGCGVAAAELAMLAGADRIEGTLFGNGERTGNVDIVTLALNLFTQGVDPLLDLSDINAVRSAAEHCNRLPVHPRHPYVGELVFTAFSGSHQDAIRKGFNARRQSNEHVWDVPYLPIDPKDVGRNYEAIIRINSQSGKGGIAYIMENDFNLALPRGLQIEFSQLVQHITDDDETEVSPTLLWDTFDRHYLAEDNLTFINHWTKETQTNSDNDCQLSVNIRDEGAQHRLEATGNGPLDAYMTCLANQTGLDLRIEGYHQHAIGAGSDAKAVAYVEVGDGAGTRRFGVGIHPNIVIASLLAATSGVRHLRRALAEHSL